MNDSKPTPPVAAEPVQAVAHGVETAGRFTPVKGARLSVAILLGINLFNYIDRYVLSAVEVSVRDSFFASDDPNAKGRMGLLATAFLVTYMLAAPVFGWLGDRWKRWTIVGIGVLLWSLATGASGLATTFTMLLCFRVLVGVGEAAWGPIAPTVIADMYPVSKRGTVLAWFNVALPVGSALGFVIGGQVLSLMNGTWGMHGWQWAFLVVVPPGIVLGIWSLFRKDPPRGAMEVGGKAGSTQGGSVAGVGASAPNSQAGARAAILTTLVSVGHLFKIRSYVYNLLGMTAMTFAVGGMSFWMPTYIHEYRMHGGTDAAGLKQLRDVTFLFGVLVVVTGLGGTILGGYLGDWLRSRFKGAYLKLSGVTMMLAFPFFLLVLNRPFPEAWYYMGISLFLAFINTGPTNTVIANVTPPARRATGYAVTILLIHAFGDAVSPPLIGAISDRFKDSEMRGDMTMAFQTVGVAMFLAGVFWFLGSKYLDRDTELAPTRP